MKAKDKILFHCKSCGDKFFDSKSKKWGIKCKCNAIALPDGYVGVRFKGCPTVK